VTGRPGDFAPERIVVVGLGLLGASLADAARRRWPQARITGVSSPGTLEKASRARLIHDAFLYTEIALSPSERRLPSEQALRQQARSVMLPWSEMPSDRRY